MLREEEFEIFIKSSFWVDEAGDIGVAVAADVFTYFESRTCENCKHAYAPSDEYSISPELLGAVKMDIHWTYCELNHMNISKDFGCNKFEGVVK